MTDSLRPVRLAALSSCFMLALATCATARRDTVYIAPSYQTVTSEIEAGYDGVRQLIYVTNNSTVAVIVNSYRLQDCENIRTSCDVHRVHIQVRPRERVLIATILPENPSTTFNFHYSWTWETVAATQ